MSSIAGDDDAPPWMAGERPLVFDIETLEDFARVIDAEVNQNFIPYMQRVIAKLRSPGPTLAPEGFLELSAALDTYSAARDQAVALLIQHADASNKLAAAAKIIAQRYRGADGFAAVTVDEVRVALAPTGQELA
jgi:hypothetical protein